MKEVEYDWFDTEVLRRLGIALFAVAIVLLFLTAVLILTGLLAKAWIVFAAMIVTSAIVLAYYYGSTDVLKKNPTTIGLSAKGIRLLYSYGEPKDIQWDDIDDVLVQGSWASSRIIHRDGSFTPLWAPVKIANVIKSRYQEYGLQKGHGQQ